MFDLCKSVRIYMQTSKMKGGSMSEEIVEEKAGKSGLNLGMGAWIGIAVAALVIGILIGNFALGGGGAGASGALGKTSLTEAELDTTVGTYTSNGKTVSISAREVIEQSSSLDAAKDADGNYTVPTADTVLTVARNKIIAAEAESRGLTVTDEDLSSYAEETLGTSDIDSIASSYGMDAETVTELLRQSAQMTKLRDEVVTATETEAPEAPAVPEYATTDEEGNGLPTEEQQAAQEKANTTPKPEYAEYIIKLAGDEWDAEKGTWVAADGPYATALADYEVTADAATYEAAQAAYYVAYQDYSSAQSEVSSQWTDFVNGLLSNSSIQISTLMA